MGYVVGDDTINLNTENLKSGTMDYEKKYKKALERAKHYLTIIGVSPDEEPINVLKRFSEYVFSELVESEDKRIRNFISNELACLRAADEKGTVRYTELTEAIAWVEKQSGHTNFINKIQIGDKVTRNKDGVLVNLSQLKRVAKPADKIQLGKKYKCIASPRYSTFTTGKIYKPEDKYLCDLMNFCSDCFEPIEDGEQKPAEEYNITGIGSKNAQGKLGEMIKNLKSTDKVEPKFKISDWIIRSAENFEHNKYLITEIRDCYVCEDLKDRRVTFTFNDVHKNFKLWDISDAKDGDVLVFSDHGKLVVGIVSCINKSTGKVDVYCLLEDNTFKVGNFYALDTINPRPATKEQRDLLFQKMHEAGYEWDAKKKELKKIEHKSAEKVELKFGVGDIIKHKDTNETFEVSKIEIFDADEIYYHLTNGGCICENSDNFERVEQNPVWSEEERRNCCN